MVDNFAATSQRKAHLDEEPQLIPQPQSIHMREGHVLLPMWGSVTEMIPPMQASDETHAACATPCTTDDGDQQCFLALQLADSLTKATGLTWDISTTVNTTTAIVLTIDTQLAEHAYELKIEDSALPITLHAHDIAALRDAVQTLRQLIAQFGTALPCMLIHDKPAYAVRSYSLDVTRGRVPTMAWLKTWIDKLSLYKYNQLQLYVEHTGKIDGLSESWRGTSPLTSTDFIVLDEYCAERGIELVPSISTFGHHYMTLRTHSYRELGEFPEQAERTYSFIERQEHHTLNINHPEALQLSCKLIDAYCGLLRSRFFNIGGDETFDLGKGRSRLHAEHDDIAHMYASYVERLCNYVQQQGHQAMLWGDIAVEMPQILHMLPKNIVVLNWLYAPDITEEKVRLVAQSGVRQYVCAAVHAWNSLLPDIEGAWKNISRLASYGLQYHAEGFMVTDWGDYGHINDSRMSIPAMIYGAQEAWNPGVISESALDSRIAAVEYDDWTGHSVADMRHASAQVCFAWENIVHYLELDDGHGQVNTDVLQEIRNSGIAMDDGAHGLAAARSSYVQALASRIAQSTHSDDALVEAQSALMHDSLKNRVQGNVAIQPWLVAIEGQRLFNRIGSRLAAYSSPTQDMRDEHGDTLAADIEMWFECYAQVWRSISRESELRRIADDIWACADIIRSQSHQQERQ